jgi:hypothetical protein
MLGMHPTTLLAAVNEQHGTTFALSNRYPHGESGFGAYAVLDAMGQRPHRLQPYKYSRTQRGN